MKNLSIILIFLCSFISYGQTIEEDIKLFFDSYYNQDYSKAIQYENNLLNFFKPFKDSNYIDILFYTGKVNEFLGNKSKSMDLAIENYALTKQVISPKNFRFNRSINTLADIYKMNADYKNAKKYYEESWDSFQKYGGLSVPDQVKTRSNLAFTYLMTSEFMLAMRYYNENLEFIDKNYGQINYNYASDLELLADAKKNIGQVDLAFNDYEAAKKIYFRLNGKDNSNSAFCSVNQAAMLSNIENKETRIKSLKYFKEFDNYYKGMSDTLNDTYLVYRVSQGMCLNSLAYDYKWEGNIDSSDLYLKLCKDAFENIIKSYSHINQKKSRNYLTAIGVLASIFDEQQNYPEAIKQYQFIIDKSSQNDSLITSAEILYFKSRLGRAYIENGNVKKGEIILENISKSLDLILKESPMSAFGVLSNLSKICSDNNDIQGEINLEKLILNHGKNVYNGELNNQVLLSHKMLSNLYYRIKNADSIYYHLEKAKEISIKLNGFDSEDYIEILSREIMYLSTNGISLSEKLSNRTIELFDEFDSLCQRKKVEKDIINLVVFSKQSYYSSKGEIYKALSLQQSESHYYYSTNDTITTILLRIIEVENLSAIGKYYDAYKIGHELFLQYPKMPKDHLMKLVRTIAILPFLMDNNKIQETYSLLKWSLELHESKETREKDTTLLRFYINQYLLYCKVLPKVGKLDDAITESIKCLNLITKNFGDSQQETYESYYNLGLLYMLKDQPNEAIKYLVKANTEDQNMILGECNIALGNYRQADEQLILYNEQRFKIFLEEINRLSERDFPYRKINMVTHILGLLNYAVFRAQENPKLLEYVIEKWFFLNCLGFRKGRLYSDLAKNAGLEKQYHDIINQISNSVQLPPEIRKKENLDLENLVLKQRKIEMEIGEKTKLFDFDYSIESKRKQLSAQENYVFVIPFHYIDLKTATSSIIAKREGEYAYFIGSIDDSKEKINFQIIKNAFELRNEAFQYYQSFLKDFKKGSSEDVESYINFIKPIEHFFHYKKTYFCGADVYSDINIESIYHPVNKKSILETYNISIVDPLTTNLHNDYQINFNEVILFGGIDYGDGKNLAQKTNDLNKLNSIIGIQTLKSSENKLLVFNVEPNFPAEKAGIKVGDVIVEVNGEKVDLTSNEENYYLSRIRGPEGTNVTLKLQRNTPNGNIEVNVKREIPSIAIPRETFQYLPGTLIEIKGIAKILKEKSKNINTFSGKDASELNLKKINNPSILHIATHAFFVNPEFPKNTFTGINDDDFIISPSLRNGIVMTGVNDFNYNEMQLGKENGFVNGLELSELLIQNTNLVVISGCESGTGTGGIGEDMSGIKEALFRAGARNLILAKFSINDKVTQEFFIEFYTRLKNNSNLEEVLRETKLELSKKYNHPYFWSAFQLFSR